MCSVLLPQRNESMGKKGSQVYMFSISLQREERQVPLELVGGTSAAVGMEVSASESSQMASASFPSLGIPKARGRQ